MTPPADWERLRTLFEGALALPQEQRAAYLDAHINGDDVTRREVETLLAAHVAAEGFLSAARVGPGVHVAGDRPTGNGRRLPASRLETGSHLGAFEILEPLGIGGMGEVYRARDTRLDRFVAIKVLSRDLDESPRGRERFVREARAISRLSHPHICTVHDIGSAQVDGKDVPFLVMELLDGETLAARISRGHLSLEESLTCAVEISDGLAAAHRQGIVHRDLKPANVMMTRSGVKLLDFGLAQLRGTRDGDTAAVSDTSLTGAGMVFGTVPYMAPEQLRGEKADARADVFAFGALLHEMLTGRHPFSADSQAGLIAAILEHEPPLVSTLQPRAPASLDRIVRRCLAKDAEDRWQTAGALSSALQRAVEEIGGRGPFPLKRAARVGVPVAALLAGTIWALWPASEAWLPAPSLGPLTAFHGDEGYPAFSPDGGQVAFAWNGEKRENVDIYIKRIDADTPLRLTTDPADDIAPAWSPEGSRIAFVRVIGNQASIYLTAPVPGAERKLVDYTPSSVGYPAFSTLNHSISWSHDSRSIIVAARLAGEGTNAVLAVPAGGGEPRVVLSRRPEEGDFRFPTISPTGRSLAYAFCIIEEACDLYEVAIDAHLTARGEPKRLTRQPAAPIYGVSWTPDGRSLVYGSWAGTLNLWRVSTTGAEPKRLELGIGGLRPDVSRAGNRLAYSRLGPDSDLWKFEAGAGPVPVASSSLLDVDAQLSPDGRRIALSSERSGGAREIWIVNIDGTGAVRLTGDSGVTGLKGTPRWSPDGRRIAYDVRGEDGRFGVYVIDAAGGSPRQLTTDGVVPSWSRNGDWIYFRSTRSGTTQIWRIPPSGGDAEQVTEHGGQSAWESWDGTTLYYDRRGGLYAKPVTGGPEEEVLPPALGVNRNFFPATDGIYYAIKPDVQRPHAYEIRFLSFATARSETLYRFESLGLSQGLSVSPDGNTIIFSGISPSKNTDLMLIQNFR